MASTSDATLDFPNAYLAAFAAAVHEHGQLRDVYVELCQAIASEEPDKPARSQLRSLQNVLRIHMAQVAFFETPVEEAALLH